MGIILLPFLLGAVFLLVPGAILGAKAVLSAPHKLLALLVLVTLAVLLHAFEFCVPFAIVSGRSVSPFLFLLFLLCAPACAALFGGTMLKSKFVKLSDSRYAIGRSALYVAAGFIPVSWFSYGEHLQRYFSIKWIY